MGEVLFSPCKGGRGLFLITKKAAPQKMQHRLIRLLCVPATDNVLGCKSGKSIERFDFDP